MARTTHCTQLFREGRAAGVQFHPEVTREMVAGWVSKCPPDYFVERGTTGAALIAAFDEFGELAAKQATELFDWFLDDVAR